MILKMLRLDSWFKKIEVRNNYFKRDGVCNPVPNVSAMSELCDYIYCRLMFRTGQHTPSGCTLGFQAPASRTEFPCAALIVITSVYETPSFWQGCRTR